MSALVDEVFIHLRVGEMGLEDGNIYHDRWVRYFSIKVIEKVNGLEDRSVGFTQEEFIKGKSLRRKLPEVNKIRPFPLIR